MTRLPDFLIVGAQKAGTTSLFSWLGEHPKVTLPGIKEPHFFSDDRYWKRGVRWYADLFSHVPPQHLTGEASPLYGDPAFAAIAADRIRTVVPNAKLVYLLRDPTERLRSHFRHEIQRGREQRTLADAVSDPGNAYVRRSRYSLALSSYLDVFPHDQIAVVALEHLTTKGEAWRNLLRHLGLEDFPLPEIVKNAAAQSPRFTRPMLWLWERGFKRPPSWLPGPVRSAGRLLLLRADGGEEAGLERSREPLPEQVALELADEVSRLQTLLGLSRPLWPRAETATAPPSLPVGDGASGA